MKQEAEKLIAEIEQLFPQVRADRRLERLRRDAIGKARAVVEQGARRHRQEGRGGRPRADRGAAAHAAHVQGSRREDSVAPGTPCRAPSTPGEEGRIARGGAVRLLVAAGRGHRHRNTEIMLGDDELGIGSSEEAAGDGQFSDVEITTSESEIALADLDLEEGDDPCPSPYERVTVAPQVPESEYVARMMREAPPSDPCARSRARRRAVRTRSGRRAEELRDRRHSSARNLAPDRTSPCRLLISSWPARRRRLRAHARLVDSSPPPAGSSSTRPLRSLPHPRFRLRLTSRLGDAGVPTACPTSISSPAPNQALPRARSRSRRSRAHRRRSGGRRADRSGAAEPEPPLPNGRPLSFGPASGDALELVGVRAQSVKPPGAAPASRCAPCAIGSTSAIFGCARSRRRDPRARPRERRRAPLRRALPRRLEADVHLAPRGRATGAPGGHQPTSSCAGSTSIIARASCSRSSTGTRRSRKSST